MNGPALLLISTFVFTGSLVVASSSAFASASSLVSHVYCDGTHHNLLIDRITHESGKTRVLGRNIQVSVSDFPRPVGKGRSTRRNYMSVMIPVVGYRSDTLRLPITQGIRFNAERTDWLWSEEQERQLIMLDHRADEAIRQYQRTRGVVSALQDWALGPNRDLQLPEVTSFREMLKTKSQILRSRGFDYELAMANFLAGNRCELISYTINPADVAEMTCTTAKFTPASVEIVLGEEFWVAADWAKGFNAGLAAVQSNRHEQAYLGTFNSCDGFALAK
jgi:hypothetical protein